MSSEVTPAIVKKTRLETARHRAAQATAILQKLEAQASTKASSEKRRIDTRKKVLLGAYLLSQMQADPTTARGIVVDLDAYLTRSSDRAIFDLPALPAVAG